MCLWQDRDVGEGPGIRGAPGDGDGQPLVHAPAGVDHRHPGSRRLQVRTTYLRPLLGQKYCEIIYIRWTFYFVYFVGRTILKFKIPTNTYYFTYIAYNLNPSV